MKFESIKVGDLLWHQKMPGAFLVMFKSEGGAIVTNLFLNDSPRMIWGIEPADNDDWVVDDKNHPLTEGERSRISSAMVIWEALKP